MRFLVHCWRNIRSAATKLAHSRLNFRTGPMSRRCVAHENGKLSIIRPSGRRARIHAGPPTHAPSASRVRAIQTPRRACRQSGEGRAGNLREFQTDARSCHSDTCCHLLQKVELKSVIYWIFTISRCQIS